MEIRKLIRKFFLKGNNKQQNDELIKKSIPKKRNWGKVVAKIIYSNIEIEFMYRTTKDPGCCPICGNTLRKIPNMQYVIRKKKGDYFSTDDHFTIVSEKFKCFCEENKYPNLTFIPITSSKGYYFFQPERIYKLDYKRRDVQFKNQRECCGTYDEIIGSAPSFKDRDFFLGTDDFICRSEYLFGSYERKDYLIIVGLKTQYLMKAYGLKDFCFSPVYV